MLCTWRMTAAAAALAIAAMLGWLLPPAGGLRRAEAAPCAAPCIRIDAVPGGDINDNTAVGGSFDIDIVLQAADSVASFNFVLTYDNRVLHAEPPSTAGLSTEDMNCSLRPPSAALPEDDSSADHNPATGDALLVCFYPLGGASARAGVIAHMTFTAVALGSTDLVLRDVAAYSSTGSELVSCAPVIDEAGGGCAGATISTIATGMPGPTPVPVGAPDQCEVESALNGEMVRCADGSIVRFAGVASPLGEDPGSPWATAVTGWFLAGKTLSLEADVETADAYGNRFGYPHVTGTDGSDYNVSALLIFVGMAHHADDGSDPRHAEWLAAAQTWARTACWNLWAAGNPFAAESGCT